MPIVSNCAKLKILYAAATITVTLHIHQIAFAGIENDSVHSLEDIFEDSEFISDLYAGTSTEAVPFGRIFTDLFNTAQLYGVLNGMLSNCRNLMHPIIFRMSPDYAIYGWPAWIIRDYDVEATGPMTEVSLGHRDGVRFVTRYGCDSATTFRMLTNLANLPGSPVTNSTVSFTDYWTPENELPLWEDHAENEASTVQLNLSRNNGLGNFTRPINFLILNQPGHSRFAERLRGASNYDIIPENEMALVEHWEEEGYQSIRCMYGPFQFSGSNLTTSMAMWFWFERLPLSREQFLEYELGVSMIPNIGWLSIGSCPETFGEALIIDRLRFE